MPAHNALGPDHDQVPAPGAAETADDHPEQLVAGAQPRSLPGRTRQYAELMAKQEIFGDQRLAVTHGRTDQADEEQETLEHRPRIMLHGAPSRPGRAFAP